MRFGTFLLGGIVGAAAVVYLSNRNKSMLWSVLTKSDSAGMMNQSNNDKSDTSKSKWSDLPAFDRSTSQKAQGNHASPSSNAKNNGFQEAFASGSMSKVSDLVNQDPELKSQVDEILAGNNQKEEHQMQ